MTPIDRNLFNDAKDTVEGNPPFRSKASQQGQALVSEMRRNQAMKKTVCLSPDELTTLQSTGEVVLRREMEPQPKIDDEGSIVFPWATFFSNGHVHTWDRNGVGGQNWNAEDYPMEFVFSEALKRTPYENPAPLGQPGDVLGVREVLERPGLEPWSYAVDKTIVNPPAHLWTEVARWTENQMNHGIVTCDSEHMPDWAIRLRILIERVSVEHQNNKWQFVYHCRKVEGGK